MSEYSNEPAYAERPAQTTRSPGADRSVTRMESHASALAGILNNLDRVELQYDNMLSRIRGNHPEATDNAKTQVDQVDPPIMQRLDVLADKLQYLTNRLNSQADELNEYF